MWRLVVGDPICLPPPPVRESDPLPAARREAPRRADAPVSRTHEPEREPPPPRVSPPPVSSNPVATQERGGEAGVISGHVAFDGVAPAIRLPVAKDVAACGGEKASPRLVVATDGSVAHAVVYLERVRGGRTTEGMAAGKLDQRDCEFVPHVQVVPWKSELVLESSDSVVHGVQLKWRDTDATAANVPFPEPGKTKKTLARSGLLEARCNLGQVWMSAFVFSVDHAYYAVTDVDGQYTLRDVPPGAYNLVLWHEGWRLTETQRDGSGNVTGLVWSDDVVEKRAVSVESGAPLVVNFTLHD